MVLKRIVEALKIPEAPNKIQTIRAHHLRFDGWAMGYGSRAGTPESVAESFTQTVIGWRDIPDTYLSWYAKTTVGTKEEDTSESYKQSLAAGMREFVDAANADPNKKITIVEEVPDTMICGRMQSCYLSQHCRKRWAQLPDGTWGTLDETADMTRFLMAAENLGVDYEIKPGMSDYDDSQQIQVRTVTLTAGKIRKVLDDMAKPDSGFADFFDEPPWEGV